MQLDTKDISDLSVSCSLTYVLHVELIAELIQPKFAQHENM